MDVKIMFYGKRYDSKPQGYEIAIIQNNFSQKEISLEDLANELSNGATFKPALLNGSKNKDWESQQIFALDFDNDVVLKDKITNKIYKRDKTFSPEEQCKRDGCYIFEDSRTTLEAEINKCNEYGILPVFGYYSFSSTDKHPKFRLVFCTNEVISDIDKRNKLQMTLINLFKNSDKITFDATRLFLGGKKLIPFNFDNRINADIIINKYYKDEYNACFNDVKKVKSNNAKAVKENNIVSKDYILNVEAIKALNVDAMKQILSERVLSTTNNKDNISSSISGNKIPLMIFKSDSALYDYINNIDLSSYLGIGNRTVNCILPEHNDNTPSAHIYISDDGTPLYKCFGCNKVRTIISITEELAQCKRSVAINFIKDVYNLKLEQSEWTVKQKQLMIDSANYLDTEEFKQTFPELSKLIRTRKIHIQKMLMHFTEFVNEDLQVDGKPLFYSGYNTLMNVCGIRQDSRKIMAQSLTLFGLLNLLNKVELEKIPEKELNKAKSISAKYGFNKLTNFYQFEEYGYLLLKEPERMAKILKDNNMTLKGLSREYILRTFGEDTANKVYPQYKYENAQGTTEKSDERTHQILECIFYCLKTKGYATEKDVVYMLSSKYSFQTTEIQIKKSLPELLSNYQLQRIRANKEIKKQYNINGNGFPFIIINQSDMQLKQIS